jgi:hypothetical protein
MDLCKYKNIFGKPNEGVHSYRIFNLAIVDILMTVFAAFVISFYLKKSFLLTLIVLFIMGIILHRLFCVKTTIDKLLFSNL